MRAATIFPVALVLAAPAAAGRIRVHLTFVPGKLTMTSARGVKGTVIAVVVADGRGSGAGWRLAYSSASRPAVASITATCAPGSTCTLPKAAGAPGGGTVLRALKGTGMGIIRLTVTLRSPGRSVSFRVS